MKITINLRYYKTPYKSKNNRPYCNLQEHNIPYLHDLQPNK